MKKYIAYCLLIAGLFIGFSAQSFAANTNKRILAISILDTIKTDDGIIESNRAFTIPFLFRNTLQDIQYPKSKTALTVM